VGPLVGLERRRKLSGLGVVQLIALLGALLVSAAPFDAAAVKAPSNGASAIRHIVIFFQENHSFDNVLGPLCASGTRAAPCDGATMGLLPSGQTIALTTSPDIVPNIAHNTGAQSTAIDGGRMDGFANISGCAGPGYACYSVYQPSQIPNLAALATSFTISDRTFESSPVPSWGGHIELVYPGLDGFTGDNPFYNNKQSPPPPPVGRGWGCDSNRDAYWMAPNATQTVLEPACIPDPLLDPTQFPHGGAYRATPVQHVDTIMDRLDTAGLSWKLYTDTTTATTKFGTYVWSICPTFADCLYTSQKGGMVAPAQILNDAANGTLPSFSILLPSGPSGPTSQHNGESMAMGDNWIGQVVSALEHGPDWSSTAIFITYDDCGCFYDHVAPPSPGLGIRVPMVIVSPFARPGFTDSSVASFASMLAFTEHTYGLAPLGSADAAAYDYSNAFNFAQAPLPGAPLVQQPISVAEQQYLAAHPPDPDDPT
jgi:phospholipase C